MSSRRASGCRSAWKAGAIERRLRWRMGALVESGLGRAAE